ncbi:hypothetical protein V6N13_086160 [Hibiscus sabdariffa]|uniref:Protein COFACTOR ASSEMBLY OF COMPLEX C SUBUNIT B CCB3, chloroplastic n=1 Tax=Hibiscus sabdariffa TaxID=183260 RepID=A0ABR2FSC0_9ROSI
MALSCHLLSNVLVKVSGLVWQPLTLKSKKFAFSERFKYVTSKKSSHPNHGVSWCSLGLTNSAIELLPYKVTVLREAQALSISGMEGNIKLHMQVPTEVDLDLSRRLLVADLDPASAKLAIGILGPFLSAFGFLFILRIVMSWYPKLPVDKFPYVIAYAPTEPFLTATRKVIPPLGGVDVTPVVWFGLVSFLNEILLGPQGLLVLISQQVS